MSRLGLAALALLACKSTPTGPERPVAGLEVGGFSGLARAGEAIWAVPERDRVLHRFRLEGEALVLEARVPIAGVPDGADTEALAFLDATRFALGTERNEARELDLVLLGVLEGERARIVDRIEVPYSRWPGLEVSPNHGLEGLCATSSTTLLVAGEPSGADAEGRWAPLARIDLATRAVTPFRARLGTATGKLSALDCEGDAIWAIERHYEVSRIVRYRFEGDALRSSLLVDLARPDGPNWEALAVLGARALVVSDNQGAFARGPTFARVVPLRSP